MSSTPLELTRKDGIARIRLARPGQGNTIDLAMAKALMDAAAECDADPEVRCVLLSAEGKLFCGGGDVHAFADAGEGAAQLIKAITSHLHAAIATFLRMEKPLVTLVQGAAAGAGVSLAALGDVALASREAQFTLAYTAIGLTPDAGSTWFLPRLIGLKRAQELILTNRRVGAEEAAEIGLVTRAVDPLELASEGEKVAAKLASGATAAFGQSRLLLLESFGSTLETQMEREARSISAAVRGPEGRQGIASFLSRRSGPHS